MKTNFRKIICILTVIACLCALPLQTFAASRTQIPDICNVLGFDGEYAGSETTSSGTTYDYYYYSPVMTMDDVIEAIARYSLAMSKLGFEEILMEIEGDFGLGWHVYYDGENMVDIIFDAAEDVDYSNLDNAGEIQWLLILSVPSDMDFRLGRGVQGVTAGGEDICCLCEGHGRCTFCSGRGTYRMCRQTFTCSSCQGSGACSMCYGHGVYQD